MTILNLEQDDPKLGNDENQHTESDLKVHNLTRQTSKTNASGSDSGHELTATQSLSGASTSSFIDDDDDSDDRVSQVSISLSADHEECKQSKSRSRYANNQADDFGDANEFLPEAEPTAKETDEISRQKQGFDDLPRNPNFDLKAQLEETRHVLELALNNQFIRALEICEPRANEELYSGLAYATLCFLRASLTMEPSDLEAAVNGINKTFEVAQRSRRKTSMFTRLLYKPNYDTYSDEEIHAELVEAESLLLLSLISFLSDQSVICLVRSALRIRACYQRYKECLLIMRTRTNWSSEPAQRHFESGVRMGYGTFNLLMSYLPRRVLRILEYVGFSGNRTLGIGELDQSIKLGDGLRSTLSALITLVYHSYIENIFGLGNYEPKKVEQVSELLLSQHPGSAFFLLFRGRYHQMLGRLDEALETFQKSIDAQDDWVQFHSICHWEMMWCHAARMEWSKAAHYADLLRKRSKWSPASYTYQYATFLYAQLVEDQRRVSKSGDDNETYQELNYQRRIEEIAQIMETVPSLRVRIAGKTVPAEKFAIVRSGKFLELGNKLTLPSLEFLYIWNIFVYLRNCPLELEKLLERIDSETKYINYKGAITTTTTNFEPSREQDANESENDDEDDRNSSSSGVHSTQSEPSDDVDDDHVTQRNDDFYIILLLKGMCLKQLGRLEEADSVLTRLVDSNELIQEDTFIVPHAAMELALLKLQRRQFDEAKKIIRMVRNEHTGYLHETMVHFKLHAASRLIRLEVDQQQSQSPQDFSHNSMEKQSQSNTIEDE